MGRYDKVSQMLEEEIDKIGMSGKLTTSSLEVGDKAAHFLKSIKTIEAMEEAEGGSYDGSYDSYEGGSYARGRGRNARRDSMGRYSSERGGNRGGGRSSRDGYSSRDYSGNKQQMMMELEELRDKIEGMEE